ncbi:MAG: hypothetical protein Q9195_006274 [Heterodermia aff. obscurata]
MAPKTGEDFVLKINQYYKAQEPYVELLKQAIEREPDNDHHGDSKRRYTDVHRELAERVTKPMSSFNWDAGFSEKEMAKAFGNLEVEVKNKDIVDEKRASKT